MAAKTAVKRTTGTINSKKISKRTVSRKATTRQTTGGVGVGKKASSRKADLFGLPLGTWVSGLRKGRGAEAKSGRRGFVFAISRRDAKAIAALVKGHLSKWQLDLLDTSEAESLVFQGMQGPVWILRAPRVEKEARDSSQDPLGKSGYARLRDLVGAIVPQLTAYSLDKLFLEFHELSLEEERGAIVGLEMASYSFQENRGHPRKPRKTLPQLLLLTASDDLTPAEVESCGHLALAVNMARHLVNLPGGDLNPRTYSEAIKSLFRDSSSVTVDSWEGRKLVAERMNLLLAVGGGAAEGPRFVHLRYRPPVEGAKGASQRVRPIAIVGKGITFDSGGLDIKPSSGMRLMKKDMGGSAAAVAIMKWAELSRLSLPLDIYLSLAENAVSGSSFRPGDIVTARSGLTIEIHNTDAEGRLALADALDVAVTRTGPDEPSAVIDLATLTGAIKVGLGAEIAGLFTNSDDLAREITEAGRERGDLSWRMPLYAPYKSGLRSTFAEWANCGDGFGGAITAALFLELFVKGKPWAHLDIYAWKDSAGGAWAESGGSGQPVQALARVLARLASESDAEELA